MNGRSIQYEDIYHIEADGGASSGRILGKMAGKGEATGKAKRTCVVGPVAFDNAKSGRECSGVANLPLQV